MKCDDICFTHVLPRLNATDLKFLYGVNTETRKLIKRLKQTDLKFLDRVNGETRALVKRSSRADDLKKKFKIAEMSSISTLEVAWENRWLWPSWWTERHFCEQVAETNILELLKWIREEKKCEWDSGTINAAAEQGNMEMVKYCVASECPITANTCAFAAKNGHLECLKYLREEGKAPWDWNTAWLAAKNGHLHILEYLVERKYDQYSEWACWHAAEKGHLNCLKYLHETAKAPWDYKAVRYAHRKNHLDCVQYLLDNNCPLPLGWSYEGGKLHTSR